MDNSGTELRISATVVFKGRAEGEALVTNTPLTFWGGMDPSRGVITDVLHELHGQNVAGKVLVFPWGAGSSSGCGVLMEMLRCGVAPAGIINMETEAILALGPIIGQELYGKSIPIVTVNADDFASISTGDRVLIDEGLIRVLKTC